MFQHSPRSLLAEEVTGGGGGGGASAAPTINSNIIDCHDGTTILLLFTQSVRNHHRMLHVYVQKFTIDVWKKAKIQAVHKNMWNIDVRAVYACVPVSSYTQLPSTSSSLNIWNLHIFQVTFSRKCYSSAPKYQLRSNDFRKVSTYCMHVLLNRKHLREKLQSQSLWLI